MQQTIIKQELNEIINELSNFQVEQMQVPNII